MPEHLVERINASLAAAQTERAAGMADDSVSPMVTGRAHRPTRLLFAVAGAAAAVVLVAVVSSISFSGSQTTASSIGASVASTSTNADHGAEATPNAIPRSARDQLDSKAQPAAAGRDGPSGSEAISGTGLPVGAAALQIRQSGLRYTQAGFLAQAVSLHHAALTRDQFQSAANVGPASTTDWIRECMRAIGASGIQLIEADIAFYEGRPAVIIVGMANGAPLAYVVAPQCSHADPAILHPATDLT